MANVDVKITMPNFSGLGLFVRIDNNNLFFNGSGIQTLNLIPQNYIATVSGHEPSSSNVLIQFIQNGVVIGHQSFSTPNFSGFIPFTVQ